MIPLNIHRFWRIKSLFIVLMFMCVFINTHVSCGTMPPGRIKDWSEVSQYVPMLKDPDAKVRRMAVSELGGCNSPRAIDPLVAVLNDPDVKVRANAVTALGSITANIPWPVTFAQAPRLADALIVAMKDSEDIVRVNAVDALAGLEWWLAASSDPMYILHHTRLVEALTAALKDPNDRVRVRAARTLGRINKQ